MNELDHLREVLKPIVTQVVDRLKQDFGFDFNNNYVDPETRTLFIFGKPVISATQKIYGDYMLDTKKINPTTFSYMQGVIRLDRDSDFLVELNDILTPEYLESLYSQISEEDAALIPYAYRTTETRKECKEFYTFLGYSRMFNAVSEQINLIGKFRRIENLNLIINKEFNDLIKPYYAFANCDFDIYTYLQALSIHDVVMQLKESNPLSLESLYYVFRLWAGCRLREFMGNTIKSYDDYYNGEFICATQTISNRVRYIETDIMRYKLSDQCAWQWLVTGATIRDLKSIRHLYCKNDPKQENSFSSGFAYNNFDLCRESIGAIAKLHTTIKQDLRLAIIKNLVGDGIIFNRLGASLPFHEEYLNLPEFVSGELFKNLVAFIASQVGRNGLTESDIINYLKYVRTQSGSLMNYLTEGSVYATATRNKTYAFSNAKFDERYNQYLEHASAKKSA